MNQTESIIKIFITDDKFKYSICSKYGIRSLCQIVNLLQLDKQKN